MRQISSPCKDFAACLEAHKAQQRVRARPRALGARYLISQQPEVEAALVAELGTAGLLATKANPNPPHIGLDDLARLPYLACVCKVRRSNQLEHACVPQRKRNSGCLVHDVSCSSCQGAQQLFVGDVGSAAWALL